MKRIGFCKMIQLRSWGTLAFGQAVHIIVEKNVYHIQIAAGSVQKVTEADGESITIAANTNDLKFGIGHFDAHSHRKKAAMHTVESIGLDISGNSTGTTDAGNKNGFMRRLLEYFERFVKCGKKSVIATARTPDRFVVTSVIIRFQLCHAVLSSLW